MRKAGKFQTFTFSRKHLTKREISGLVHTCYNVPGMQLTTWRSRRWWWNDRAQNYDIYLEKNT